MTEEPVQQIAATSQSDEAATSLVQQRVDGVGRRVEQLPLHRTVAQLLGIQVGRVRRQPFHLVVRGVGGQERTHLPGLVGREPIPDDEQGAPDPLTEVAQRDEDLLPVDSTPEVPSAQRWRPIQGGDQGDDAGHLAPLTDPFQDWGMADGRPRGADGGPKRVTRLVHEGHGTPVAASPLLIRGQSRRSQAAITASSRSLARRSGRWGLQSQARSARLSERKWY